MEDPPSGEYTIQWFDSRMITLVHEETPGYGLMPCALISGVTGQDGSFLAEQLLFKATGSSACIGVCRRRTTGGLRTCRSWNRCVDLLDLVSLLDVFETRSRTWCSILLATLFLPLGPSRYQAMSRAKGAPFWTFRRAAQGRFYQASSSEMFGDNAFAPQTKTPRFLRNRPTLLRSTPIKWRLISRGVWAFVSCGILFNHSRNGEASNS